MKTAWLILAAAVVGVPASAQSTFPLEGVDRQPGPNARASQRPLGPNGQAAQRPSRADVNSLERADSVNYPNCAAVRTARATPIRRGEPAYSPALDRDGDGVACE